MILGMIKVLKTRNFMDWSIYKRREGGANLIQELQLSMNKATNQMHDLANIFKSKDEDDPFNHFNLSF